jgi:hypothetical protein
VEAAVPDTRAKESTPKYLIDLRAILAAAYSTLYVTSINRIVIKEKA